MIPRLPERNASAMAWGTSDFRLDNFRAHFLRLRPHLLLDRDRGGAPHFRFRLGDALVRVRLLALQFRADVVAHIDIGDIDRKNFERGVAVESLCQHRFGNAIRIFQHILVRISGADRADDPFAHSRNDRFLRRATDEAVEMRAHRHARFYFRADAVLGYAVDGGAAHRRVGHIDHFGIDAGAHRFEHRFARAFGREIDGAGAIEIERDAGLVRRDQREDYLAYVAPRQIMRFQWIAREFRFRLLRQ